MDYDLYVAQRQIYWSVGASSDRRHSRNRRSRGGFSPPFPELAYTRARVSPHVEFQVAPGDPLVARAATINPPSQGLAG